ncbi:MAG: signal recognition particle-docking protein FtsY [Candidatus Riflebacteria bacterium]|nr:signal recognition particle-docking protein FtsY [Candidatus Riflebacteria bacterium]
MAWLLPFEDNESADEEQSDDEDEKEDTSDSTSEKTVATSQADIPTEKRPVTVTSEKAEEKPVEESEKKKLEADKSQGLELTNKPQEEELSWFQRLSLGLTKTREGFVGKLKKLVFGTTKIDDDLMDELEETLFEADVGVKTTEELLNNLKKKVEDEEIKDPNVIYESLRDQLRNKLAKFTEAPRFNEKGLTVFIIIGVNGVGKTTTIAKLANKYKKDGKKVILAAGDTFRAAAIDQISIWGERAGVEVIRGQEGGDPGALVFDAIHAAKKREADLLIIDTAGRMHVKANLMAELNKVMKIVQKESDGGPHEIFLVLDATTGQNAVQQAKQFNEIIPITGLVVTKLDGTAKGGVLFAVEEELNAPVKFIGVGEKMDDLMPFEPEKFLEALFADDVDKKKESDYNVVK